eukprot:s2276_g12.t1
MSSTSRFDDILQWTRWVEPPSIPRSARGPSRRSGRQMGGKVEDLLDAFRCEVSDTDSGSEGPAELEEGLVTSRMPGFGRGVPPSTRIQQCVAVAFSEAEVRHEGSRFFVLTTAHDGYNLTWLPSLQDAEKSARDDPGWIQVALLPFCSEARMQLAMIDGLAARGPSKRQATSGASGELSDPTQVTDVLGEEIRQHGWEGVHALIFILAKLYATPQNAFGAMEPESFGRKLQIRQDVEALTGLKTAQLFKLLDVRGNGYLVVEDLICSVTPHQQCSCEEGSNCISEVWKQVAELTAAGSFARGTSGTGSSHSLAQESGELWSDEGYPISYSLGCWLHAVEDKKKTTLNLKWTKQANRRKELNSSGTVDGRSDEGSRTTRGEIHRRNEVMRKERESCEVQDISDESRSQLARSDTSRREYWEHVAEDTHLDLERERFITTVQRTTVLHPLDYQEMESKRRLVQRLAAEAEAAFARKKGAGSGDDDEGLETLEPDNKLLETPGVTKSAQAKKLARASAQAQPLELRRLRSEVASLVVDPKRPRVAAGIGDGQLAVYYLFRSHGSKRKQLHQIQGFDASRGLGDVCTALCLPTQRLSDEGSMAVETVLGGFESGRVAVFRSFFPDDFVETSDKKIKKTLEEVMEERQRIKSLANGEPVLQAEEPLLLEHFHCSTPIVALYWHHIMGIFSISTTGHVVVADSCGVQTFSIHEACGRNSTVASADLSVELEQLAVSGQRGVHLWQILSQAKYGVIGVQENALQNPEQNFNVMLVTARALMNLGRKFLLTLHRDGIVKIWDSRSLELHTSTVASRKETLLIFSPDGVTELEVHEDKLSQGEGIKSSKLQALPSEPRKVRGCCSHGLRKSAPPMPNGFGLFVGSSKPAPSGVSAANGMRGMTAFRGGPVRAKANLFGESDVPRRNRPATASPGRASSRTASPSRPNSRPPSPGPRDDRGYPRVDRPGPDRLDRPKSRSLTSHMRRAPSPTPAFNKSAPGKPRWRS